jgi:CheY-like chemotaxis protein
MRDLEKNSHFRLPAIAITSYTREFSAAHALGVGFDEFIAKPINPNFLVSAIHTLVSSRE